MMVYTLISRTRCVLPFVDEILRQHVLGNACMAGPQVANGDTTMFFCEFQYMHCVSHCRGQASSAPDTFLKRCMF